MNDYILQASLDQKRVITIIYMKDGLITKRNIQVVELSSNTIKAYCYLRNAYRFFKTTNILSASFPDRSLFKYS